MLSRVLLRRTLVLPILVAALAACSDDDDNTGPGAGSFTLGAPANAAVTLVAGQATTVTIPVTFTGSMSAVTLTADSLPAGVRVGFQPSVISNGTEQVTVSITANPDAAIGTRTIKIIAKSADMEDQVARIAVTTTAMPTYTLTNPTTIAAPIAIQRTASGTVTLTIDRSGGFTGPVDIIPDALPAGVTVAPLLGVTGNTATLTINTAPNAVATTGSFTVRATNPTMGDRPTTIRYSILAEPGVQIAFAARSALQSSPDTMFVTVNREGGFTGSVTVTLSGLPTGVTADPVTSAAGTSVAIPLDITDDAATGAKTVTATVSGTGIATKTATATLTIVNNLLTSGTAVTIADSRARNSYTIYRVVAASAASAINVTLAGGTGDADIELYDASFDLIDGSYNAANGESITATGLAAGTYYVVVWVWDPYANASLKATVTSGSPAAALSAMPVGANAARRLTLTPHVRR
jgi:hypothetical protein